MNELPTNKKIRVSKKVLSDLKKVNPLLAKTLKALAEKYHFKSFTFFQFPEGRKFHAGEGINYTFVYGTKAKSVEMVSEHNFGARNVHYSIGQEFSPPCGTTVFQVSYYSAFHCDMVNIVERALPEPKV